MYQRVKDGIYYHPKMGRIVEHHGYSTRIHWSAPMLDYLRRHFPVTLNEDLAGYLGVSQRTLSRKARELGLRKDPVWLHGIWDDSRRLAHIASRRNGNTGMFRKGLHANPGGEFKPGHRLTPEQERKRSESLRRWYRLNPEKAIRKAEKAWATRRRRLQEEQIINK